MKGLDLLSINRLLIKDSFFTCPGKTTKIN